MVDINREEMMLNVEKIEIEMHHSSALNVAKKVIWLEIVQVVDLLLMMTDAPVVEVIMQTEAAEMHPGLIHVLNAERKDIWQENVQMKKKQILVEKV